jgi:O-antigen ligase
MHFLIALFSLACLVWMVPLLQRGRMIGIAMLVLGVGTVFGPSFFAFDGPIQISLDRLLWLGMLGVAVIGWRLGRTHLPKLNRMDWLLIGILCWFFASALRGGVVPTGSSPVARWLFYLLMPAGMYAAARMVEIRAGDVRWILGGSIVLGVYLAVTALLEVNEMHSLVFPRFIADAEEWEFFGRGRGPLLNPAGNGFLMSIALVAAALGFLYAPRRGKLMYALVAIVLCVGVYATLTRSAWVGGCFAVGVVGLMYSPRWARVLALATVVVLGGASLAGARDQLLRMKRDKILSAEDAEKSVQLRPLLAVVAWEMFKDHPIIGHGYGHYFEHNDPYHNDRSYELPLEQARTYAQHNVFLSILVDTGMVGLAMFVSWMAILAGIGWRLARDWQNSTETRWIGLLLLGAMTAYVCNGMFQDVMIIPMVHMFLFFLAGVSVTVYERGLAVSVPERLPVRPAHPAVAVAP